MEKAKRRGGESLCLSSRDRKVAVTFPTVARATPKARKATRSAETGKNAPGQRRAGSGTLFGASMFGAESDGTPDARTIHYNYPTSGDGNVIARLDHIAAAKNPARKEAKK